MKIRELLEDTKGNMRDVTLQEFKQMFKANKCVLCPISDGEHELYYRVFFLKDVPVSVTRKQATQLFNVAFPEIMGVRHLREFVAGMFFVGVTEAFKMGVEDGNHWFAEPQLARLEVTTFGEWARLVRETFAEGGNDDFADD